MRPPHIVAALVSIFASLAGTFWLIGAHTDATVQPEWELVRSVSSRLSGTVDLVLIPPQKQRDNVYYLEIANSVCGDRTACMVMFWADRNHIPKSANMPVTDLQLMTAHYERHPSYSSPILALACWLYPNKEAAEQAKCFYMPGGVMPWEKSAAEVSPVATEAPPPLRINALACMGLVGIFAGVFALQGAWKFATRGPTPKNWLRLRMAALIVGVAGGIATWPLTYSMGYPIKTAQGVWRIVGIPFVVALFDSDGRDYVGVFTLPAVVANIVFWSLFPQLILLLWGHAWRKRRVNTPV